MKKSILFILFFLSISYSVFGQVSVSGRVVDYDGALAGVMVQIKGTVRGTVTNLEGNFSLLVSNSEDILIFSYEGMITKEIRVSKIDGDILLEHPIIDCPIHIPYKKLTINYWNGISYNPYGISANFSWVENIVYRMAELGFSTNFNQNTDFYGKYGRRILRQFITYKFQQTTFIESESKNRITTHLLENNHDLRHFYLTYGIGYQIFAQEKTENISTQNIGLSAGISKYIPYFTLCSVKSFYWLDYWAWEMALDRTFARKIHTSVSYRQTTQDFKEINLTLGYIF